MDDGAPEIVFARRRHILDLPPPDIDITADCPQSFVRIQPASSAASPTTGLKMEPGA